MREQFENESYDRGLRETKLLKKLDRALVRHDAGSVLKFARLVCAMHCYKWGMNEQTYLKARPL